MADNAKPPLDGRNTGTATTAPESQEFTTGILPSQTMRALIDAGDIQSDTPIPDGQIQPASIDLRLGDIAYRVRGSFLPGPHATVRGRLESFTMHEIDLTDGAVLEKGCVYLVPLQERLNLKKDISGMANPKSSTGRLDIFTRMITDYTGEFDRVPAGYKGPLYAEISPLTFSIKLHTGTRLSQLRLRRGSPPSFETSMRRLHERSPLVAGSGVEEADITSTGVAFTVDLQGDSDTGIIGYKAKRHADVIDVENIDHYNIQDFWDPIHNRGHHNLTLDTDDFYILASKEAVSVPPDHAAEMRPYDTYVGEFRVHYAGFFDPGFGHDAAGGSGSRAVLEVRSHDVPFVLEDGQVVGRLVYERLTAVPDLLYGHDIGSNYQQQGLKLSKHFK
ncbi:MAG: 2'-deoxycytidine 5'-triphosphate deaminase [Rhodospirillales bacterium]|nr:2'-deoxycytidine 5'-triphosphate deaminase [Rhodospirillales bacterium]